MAALSVGTTPGKRDALLAEARRLKVTPEEAVEIFRQLAKEQS
jgi:hypothetical protein